LCRFVAYLGQQSLRHRTIKAYLSGIRFAHIHHGLGGPFRAKAMPLLEYILSGIKREQARAIQQPKPRLPITHDILAQLHSKWYTTPPTFDGLMLWAASCTFFGGFLRAGKFTLPSPGCYDKDVHLSLSDLATDSHSSPSVFRVRIKQSKTDPFRQKVDIYLGVTGMAVWMG